MFYFCDVYQWTTQRAGTLNIEDAPVKKCLKRDTASMHATAVHKYREIVREERILSWRNYLPTLDLRALRSTVGEV
jgi:hypothetical protein